MRIKMMALTLTDASLVEGSSSEREFVERALTVGQYE
jgi:hypothetical protein